MVVASAPGVITLQSRLKPALQIGGTIDTDHLIALGTIGEWLLMQVGIDKLMYSPVSV